ncbi:MAG: uroporphyrinogen-III synthase [Bacteroidota bacterium]|nr:uroporphyrinogen-III synthase [Bacteroidota bacterium]MDP4233953.1 uroporphyrinogen-III synthase [Bacteroidota bacterium]MDP4242796.1 uroporphyrinogen-III synthase [Bacteroidota bacterium]MDP4288510.1 uroporphyrinogen-III synthase [Bacteroidota bacterium]
MSSVLLTRPQLRSSGEDVIHTTLKGAGVIVLEIPMIRFELPRETDDLDAVLVRASHGAYHAIVLSSPTAVYFFNERVRELGLLDAIRITARFGAVGRATSDALELLGFEISLPIPIHAGSHQLAAMLSARDLTGKPILLLQSQIGLEILEHSLRELGAQPERQTLYYTKGPSLGDAARLLHLLEGPSRPDVIAFFSPSAVSYFVTALAEMGAEHIRKLPALATIGETTAKAVEETLRRRPEIVARKANQQSLAEDILDYLAQ